MSLAVFRYSWGLTGTFEVPTESARRVIHPSLEPVEVHHGRSILAVSAFDFSETPFGPYGELVLSIVVAPVVRAGEVMPQAALCPYAVGTTSSLLRELVLPQWPLPYWPEDVAFQFAAANGRRTLSVAAAGAPLLEMSLYEHEWSEETQVHQVLALGPGGGSAAVMTTRGAYSDHEDGRGELRLPAHPMHKGLDVATVDGLPLREACFANGTRTIESLVSL
jgi:hypothetical protein